MLSIAPEVSTPVQDSFLHVMVGILRDAQGQILISRRHGNVHLSGFWEFPGGKLDPGEAPYAGLVREISEELGVRVEAARPLTQVRHRFPERNVLLDVWEVASFSGSAHGREGQQIAWSTADALGDYRFPESNHAILRALRLPETYPITPDECAPESVLEAVRGYLDAGASMIQFRAPQLKREVWLSTARHALKMCRARDAMLVLNAAPEDLEEVPAHGIHLSAARLIAFQRRPVSPDHWLGASCHDAEELVRAVELGADFATLSPVQVTASHPGQAEMGWKRFSSLAAQCGIPVYALGGVSRADLQFAKQMGGWGVSGIRGF